MDMELIFFNPLMLALICYLVVAGGLTILMQPLRIEMVSTIEDLQAESSLTKNDKARLERLARNCMSFFVASVLPFAIIMTTVDHLKGVRSVTGREASAALRKDPRFHKVLRIYFMSILASSPILGFISLLFIGLSFSVHSLIRGNVVQDAMESPVMRAAETDRPHLRHAV